MCFSILAQAGSKKLVKNTFLDLFKRRGDFELSEDSASGNEDYKAVITLQEINLKCDIQEKGFSFLAISQYKMIANNSKGRIKVGLKLYDKKGDLIIDKSYTESNPKGYLNEKPEYKDVKHRAMQNLIGNLTLSSKSIGRQITKDINTEIYY